MQYLTGIHWWWSQVSNPQFLTPNICLGPKKCMAPDREEPPLWLSWNLVYNLLPTYIFTGKNFSHGLQLFLFFSKLRMVPQYLISKWSVDLSTICDDDNIKRDCLSSFCFVTGNKSYCHSFHNSPPSHKEVIYLSLSLTVSTDWCSGKVQTKTLAI